MHFMLQKLLAMYNIIISYNVVPRPIPSFSVLHAGNGPLSQFHIRHLYTCDYNAMLQEFRMFSKRKYEGS